MRRTFNSFIKHSSSKSNVNSLIYVHALYCNKYLWALFYCMFKRGQDPGEQKIRSSNSKTLFSVGKEEWNHFTSTALPLLLTISWRSAFVPLKAPCALTLQHSSAPTAEWVNSLCPRSRERSTATFPLEQLRPMFICSLLLSLTWSHQAHSVL